MAALVSSCPLCNLFSPKYISPFKIVQTREDHGHAERFMVVSSVHASTFSREAEAAAQLFKFMSFFGKDFAINFATHASIPEHWHRVAQTLDKDAEDYDKIKDTDRIEVRFVKRDFNEKWKQ